MKNTNDIPDPNRRDFLKQASLATVMALMGGVELRADDSKTTAPAETALTKIPAGPQVNVGVIGVGQWGREILTQFKALNNDPLREKQNNSPVVAICDTYKSWLRRAAKDLPGAQSYEDYKMLLADPNVQAVVIATPTGTHKEIALDALAAGKNVYCEAPLANTIDDAKAICRAARDAVKLVFQPGLQQRSHPQLTFLLPFVRTGALGKFVMARAQTHIKDSWHQTAPSEQREKELNWRLDRKTANGLFAEVGIHQIDTVSNFLHARPKAVTGFSSTIGEYTDNRTMPDTVQGVFEFPHGVNFFHDLTLCNSYERSYETYLGAEAAMMMRDFKAWLFKERSAALGGWEVYARHDTFYDELGIALVAGASKQTTLAGSAESFKPYEHEPLYYALDNFVNKAGRQAGEVKLRAESYPDEDPKDLADYLKTIPAINSKPTATWQDGLEATVMAIIANEAALKQQKIEFKKEWFEL